MYIGSSFGIIAYLMSTLKRILDYIECFSATTCDTVLNVMSNILKIMVLNSTRLLLWCWVNHITTLKVDAYI